MEKKNCVSIRHLIVLEICYFFRTIFVAWIAPLSVFMVLDSLLKYSGFFGQPGHRKHSYKPALQVLKELALFLRQAKHDLSIFKEVVS